LSNSHPAGFFRDLLPQTAGSAPSRAKEGQDEALRRMILIDSHCHLDFRDFADDLEGVIARALAVGVERMITIGTQVAKSGRVAEIAEQHDCVFFTVGTHPHEAAGVGAEDFSAMRRFAAHPKCVGIGEAGLDYHYNYAPREIAASVFRGQIGLARELNMPLVIHTRDADDDMAAILRDEMGQGPFTAILHSFTGSRALAETALDLGLYISFSGVVTFKNSAELRAIAREVPLDRILVETDAPYLAPVPHRGKRNEPAFVAATVRAVAETRGLSPEELAAAARANTLNVFRKLGGGRPPP
jgi:TatD DNase family protein